ncbi:MAG TPA: DUF4189 domain-containing protein [Oligoflexus sp.]|uniref:DUF4189 domain-containing protein n=1 Tax=Oligoflexus sp. TaxID=1971216 RepID=UPI002D6E66D1|nr:DUF4189 domain-containing protein [Oligoflexus sp.]HYX39038.1 DUF4189 domain-containing protein [Oligoflexus sp.]
MRAMICVLILMVHGCGSVPQKPLSHPLGYFDSYDAKWDERILSVCWESDSSARQDLAFHKTIVQETVASQYQRVGFYFTGWESCDGVASANIRIWVDAYTWPKVNAFGRHLDNRSRGVELTFDFLSAGTGWGTECQKSASVANCIRNYALHEFGHVLGLKHEADRHDATCEQKTWSPGIEIGGYDTLSIMNYCNNEVDVRANRVPILSYNDVATLLEVYHKGDASSTFAAIAWSPSTGAHGTSWHWVNQGAADATALGHCEQYGNRPGDCRVMAWAQNACAAFAVGVNQGYGWAWNNHKEEAKDSALTYCQQTDAGCEVLAAVCSQD